jgi:hypothetical protein
MPTPRKPTHLHLLSGATAKNPQRFTDRVNEPGPNGPIGEPPIGFNKARKDLWDEVVGLVPEGVLQKSDRVIVELVVMILHELRTGELNIAGIAQLRQALASLGCTPADRSRVSAAPEQKVDEWQQFAT